jgi:hypothetical protein
VLTSSSRQCRTKPPAEGDHHRGAIGNLCEEDHMSVAATFRVSMTLVCCGLFLAPTFSASQNLAQTEASIAGLWSHSMVASGAGLSIRFALSPNGTYEFYRAYTFGGNCDGLYYQGEFQIAGSTIEFFPSSGSGGGCGNERSLGSQDLAAQRPNLGNSRSNFSLQGEQLCLQLQGGESEGICFSRE